MKARQVQEKWIANAPPHIREIWDFILLKANYKDHGSIKRGQLLITYKDIQEGLAWFVGYRKETYRKHHCEIAMKALVRERMIDTTKTTRGIIITVLNYNKYQDPKNYECYSEHYNETTMKLQPTDTIREEREEREERKEDIVGQEPRQREKIPYSDIVSLLNEKAGTGFKASTQSTKSHIRARWAEGFRVDDFKAVIEHKTDEWKTDAKMCEFLRPVTLFGTKFESYLQSATASKNGENANLYGKFGKWNEKSSLISRH